MLKSVFEYKDYKDYVRERIAERGRGEKSKIANALRCHIAYLSRVLKGLADLSFEQADTLNLYFAHSPDEADYFLLLVSHSRAGTASLRRFYEEKIKGKLHARMSIENRLKLKKTLPAENQAIFYSAWYYAAIHLLIAIPEFRTKENIAQTLKLPIKQIIKALDFLVASGLAEYVHGRYQTGQVSLHLSNDSPWLAKHHASWRLQSVQALDRSNPENFHYTSLVTMSAEDVPAARKIMVEAIEKIRAVVKSSPEKNLFC